jgi:hypothetical protein
MQPIDRCTHDLAKPDSPPLLLRKVRVLAALSIASLLLLANTACSAPKDIPVPLRKLSQAELSLRLSQDTASATRCRDGLRGVLDFLEGQTNLFPVAKLPDGRFLPREEKEVLWPAWKRFLDYLVALDALREPHDDFWRLRAPSRDTSFQIQQAAFLAQYRHAMEFIEHAENNREMDKLLNDPVPELGLSANTYDHLKARFLHIARASEFAAGRAWAKGVRSPAPAALQKGLGEDATYIWNIGRGHGEQMTVANGLSILKKKTLAAGFPIQAGVSEWMGDTKVHRQGRSLVSAAQIQGLAGKLEPGDLLLERREWYLSNIGLPGYWPHAALYVGTTEERQTYFNTPEVRSWLRARGESSGDLEAFLRAHYPTAYTNSSITLEHGHRPRVLEAMSEGVVFTTLEHSAACDSLAVLRPRLPRAEKAAALLRAFHLAGRPYDYDFDFSTDAAIVCSELVYKAYEPATGITGLRFELPEVLGRKVLSPNDMVRIFDQEQGTAQQQMELVLFLDGHERLQTAPPATMDEFRQSWRRPKWHIFTQ